NSVGTVDYVHDNFAPTVAESHFHASRNLQLSVDTANASLDADDDAAIEYRMEGYDFANLIGKTITLSFWVRSNLQGTYSICFRTGGGGVGNNYIKEYTIESANTWEYKSVKLFLDESMLSASSKPNGLGLGIAWVLAAGTNRQNTVD